MNQPATDVSGHGSLPTVASQYATFAIHMAPSPEPAPQRDPQPTVLYCPQCACEVTDPLTCGDCAAVICRRCGTPLESPDELGIG